MRGDRSFPETVNVTVTNPGTDAVLTRLSELILATSALYRALNKKLDLILDSIGSANDAEAVAKIRAAAAKLKASTDTLEAAVQSHGTEGQG